MYGNAAKKLEIKECGPKTVLRDAEKKTSMWFTKHVCVHTPTNQTGLSHFFLLDMFLEMTSKI